MVVLEAVSYTHLIRVRYSSGQASQNSLAKQYGVSRQTVSAIIPVSYTHLDVYKRQAGTLQTRNVETVKSRIFLAKTQLRKLLTRDGEKRMD